MWKAFLALAAVCLVAPPASVIANRGSEEPASGLRTAPVSNMPRMAAATSTVTRLVDVDVDLEPPLEVSDTLTPARGCKGCFG